MSRGRYIFMLPLLLGVAFAPVLAQAGDALPVVKGIRVFKSGENLGVEISADKSFEYRCSKMPQLQKVVVDLPGTETGSADMLYKYNAVLVSDIRLEQKVINEVKVSRISINLAEDADYSVREDLPDRKKVTLILRRAAATAPLAGKGAGRNKEAAKPKHETARPEPARSEAQAGTGRESKAEAKQEAGGEPKQAAAKPEPKQESAKPEPKQESAKPEPKQEGAKPEPPAVAPAAAKEEAATVSTKPAVPGAAAQDLSLAAVSAPKATLPVSTPKPAGARGGKAGRAAKGAAAAVKAAPTTGRAEAALPAPPVAAAAADFAAADDSRPRLKPVVPGSPPPVVVREVVIGGDSIEIKSASDLVDFKVFTLQQPGRLVIDIPGGKTPLRSIQVQSNGFGVLKARLGFQDGKLRLVFDTGSAPFPQYELVNTGTGLRVVLR